MPKPKAQTQEPICAAVAPEATAAWNTKASELVMPTMTVTAPANTVDKAMSLKILMSQRLTWQDCSGEFGCL